jgi:hypothetical protein
MSRYFTRKPSVEQTMNSLLSPWSRYIHRSQRTCKSKVSAKDRQKSSRRRLDLERLEDRLAPAYLSFTGSPQVTDLYTLGPDRHPQQGGPGAASVDPNDGFVTISALVGGEGYIDSAQISISGGVHYSILPDAGESIGDPVAITFFTSISLDNTNNGYPLPFSTATAQADVSISYGTNSRTLTKLAIGPSSSDGTSQRSTIVGKIGDSFDLNFSGSGGFAVDPATIEKLGGSGCGGVLIEMSGGVESLTKPKVVVSPTTLEYDANGGVDYSYTVTGDPVPVDTSVALYWSRSDQFTDVIGGPAYSQDISAGTQSGEYGSYHVDANKLGQPPDGAKYMLAVTDPENVLGNFDQTNNVVAAPIVLSAKVNISVDPSDPIKNQPYTISVDVTNTSPLVLPSFTVNWTEQKVSGEKPELPAPAQPYPHQGSFDVPSLEFGGTRRVSLPFMHNWEWIDPADPLLKNLKDSATDLKALVTNMASDLTTRNKLEELGHVVEAVESFSTLLDLLEIELEPERSNNFQFGLSTDAQVVLTGDFSKDIPVEVSLFHRAQYQSYVVNAIAGKGFLVKGIGDIALSLPLLLLDPPVGAIIHAKGISELTVGVLELTAASLFYRGAKDPPDPDFKTPIEPESFSLPESEAGLSGLPLQVSLLQLQVQSLEMAELSARNEADGAGLAGDYEWQSNQLRAAAGFAGKAAALRTELIALKSLLNKDGAVLSSGNGDVPAYLQANGLPEAATDILRQAGWTDSQLNDLLTLLEQPADSTNDFEQLGLDSERVSELLDAFSSLDQLKVGIDLRVQRLGGEVQQLTAAQQAQLDEDRQTIENGLSSGIPSMSLLQVINSHADFVRQLYEETNNSLLGDELEGALGYLVQFQQLDPSIAGLQKFVSNQAASGMISADVAVLLGSALTASEDKLESGDVREFSASLGSFLSVVADNQGGGIDEMTAEELKGFGSYIQSLVDKGNASPELGQIGDRLVDEGAVLTLAVPATDSNLDATLTFSLDPGAPQGATIDPVSGVFSWTAPDGPANYTVTVRVTDNGTPALSDAKSFVITVNNVAPSNVLGNADSINENDSATLQGRFFDPGILDTHTVVIDWGDSSAQTTLDLAANVLTFSASHQYFDNPPGQPNGSYPINITVTDKDGGVGTGSTSIQVNNVPPTNIIASAPSINENQTATLHGSFFDPGHSRHPHRRHRLGRQLRPNDAQPRRKRADLRRVSSVP